MLGHRPAPLGPMSATVSPAHALPAQSLSTAFGAPDASSTT